MNVCALMRHLCSYLERLREKLNIDTVRSRCSSTYDDASSKSAHS